MTMTSPALDLHVHLCSPRRGGVGVGTELWDVPGIILSLRARRAVLRSRFHLLMMDGTTVREAG